MDCEELVDVPDLAFPETDPPSHFIPTLPTDDGKGDEDVGTIHEPIWPRTMPVIGD